MAVPLQPHRSTPAAASCSPKYLEIFIFLFFFSSPARLSPTWHCSTAKPGERGQALIPSGFVPREPPPQLKKSPVEAEDGLSKNNCCDSAPHRHAAGHGSCSVPQSPSAAQGPAPAAAPSSGAFGVMLVLPRAGGAVWGTGGGGERESRQKGAEQLEAAALLLCRSRQWKTSPK